MKTTPTPHNPQHEIVLQKAAQLDDLKEKAIQLKDAATTEEKAALLRVLEEMLPLQQAMVTHVQQSIEKLRTEAHRA